MKKNNRQYRRDGFFNLVAPLSPVLSEGGVDQPPPIKDYANPPIGVGIGQMPPEPYYDPAVPDPVFEVNFNSLSCPELANLIAQLNNILLTMKYGSTEDQSGKNSNPNQYLYYKTKLSQATLAQTINCPGPGVIPGGGSVVLPTGTQVTIGPPLSGGAGGGGGSSAPKPAATAAKKNNLWIWLLVGAILTISIYQTSKE